MCFPGSSGEQLTLSGLDWSKMKTGVQVAIGKDVLLELVYLKGPCMNQTPYFVENGDGKHGRTRISPKRYPDSARVLCKVLKTGWVKVGDTVQVLANPDGPRELQIIDDS